MVTVPVPVTSWKDSPVSDLCARHGTEKVVHGGKVACLACKREAHRRWKAENREKYLDGKRRANARRKKGGDTA